MSLFNHQSGEYLGIDTASIYYEVAGTPGKPVLLILHGSLCNLEDLNPVLTKLAEWYMLVGIDSRGHGKSSMGASRLTYERLQQDAELVLQHLHIDKFSILGFNDGGTVAYRLAAYSKLKVEKVVTIGARWHYKNADSMRIMLKSTFEHSWKEKFPAVYDDYKKLNPAPDFDTLTQTLVKMWLDPGSSGYPSFNLQRYTSPLLVIRGDNDHLLSLTAVAELCALLPTAAFLNVPFAGNDAHNTQKEMIMLALEEFFTKAA